MDGQEKKQIDISQLGLTVTRCQYCGSGDRNFANFPEQAHFGIPVYNTDEELDPHICMTSLVCNNCGHTEFFSTKALNNLARKFLANEGEE